MRYRSLTISFLSLFILICCVSIPQPREIEEIPDQTPTTIIPTLTNTPTITYSSAFGVAYSQPNQYLEFGQQTMIHDDTNLRGIPLEKKGLQQLEEIYAWLRRDFEHEAAGGRTIGVITAHELLNNRVLGGCHDFGLVFAAVARYLGYPAIVVDTISIIWAEQYQSGQPDLHVGHVFVEIYLGGKWILIDSTNGWYLKDGYNPANPIISLTGSIAGSSEEEHGFYVIRKGLDSWDCGIRSRKDLFKIMDETANQIDLSALEYPNYKFLHF